MSVNEGFLSEILENAGGKWWLVACWPQYCCGVFLYQPLVSQNSHLPGKSSNVEPVMLRKENTVHISLYKYFVRFLSLPIKFIFECSFTGPALGEGIKQIWPKGCHLFTQKPRQRNQQQHWLSLYTWAWISVLQGYNSVLEFPILGADN